MDREDEQLNSYSFLTKSAKLKPNKKALSKEEEMKVIERNMQFIKPITKGGESEI